jgi:hypothetical protein
MPNASLSDISRQLGAGSVAVVVFCAVSSSVDFTVGK